MFRTFYLSFMWLLEGLAVIFMPLLILKPKYKQSLPARFLLLHNRIPHSIQHFDYWFHSCSLGETASLKPILEAIAVHNQPTIILLTTTTQTGFKQALQFQEQIFTNTHIQCLVRYLPFEPLLTLWAKPTQKLFVLEAELWYELFLNVKKMGGEVCLLNARISSRSYPKYLYFQKFYQQLFQYIDAVFAQSEQDKERLHTLGANSITVTGNLKLLNRPKIKYLFIKPNRPLVILASTHKGEESLLFNAITQYHNHQALPYTLLIIPRHPERFNEVWALLKQYFPSQTIKRRSKDEDFLEADIALIDSIGESLEFYHIATVVVLCGSFLPIGGHNPIEVAHFKKPLLSGYEIFNQIALFDSIQGHEFTTPQELPSKLENLNILTPTQIKEVMSAEHFLNLIFRNRHGKSL